MKVDQIDNVSCDRVVHTEILCSDDENDKSSGFESY